MTEPDAARTIGFVRNQLARRGGSVRSTQARASKTNLEMFLTFLEREPLLQPIVERLEPYPFDFDTWKANLRERQLQLPSEFKERAAFCLAVLKRLASLPENSIWPLGLIMGARRGTTIDENTRQILAPLIEPLYQYLDEELERLTVVATPAEVLRDVLLLLGPALPDNIWPDTRQSLDAASRALATATMSEDYQNVARTCHQALINLGREAYRSDFRPPNIPEDPKKDDARTRFKHVLRAALKRAGRRGTRYRNTTEKFFDYTWELTNTLRKSRSTTVEDARLCLMYTYLIIWRLSTLLH